MAVNLSRHLVGFVAAGAAARAFLAAGRTGFAAIGLDGRLIRARVIARRPVFAAGGAFFAARRALCAASGVISTACALRTARRAFFAAGRAFGTATLILHA